MPPVRRTLAADRMPAVTDDIVEQLTAWRREARSPSYAEIARRVRAIRVERGVPEAESAVAKTTVYDCFRDDRRRLDIDLVVDIARALGLDGSDVTEWEAACWAANHEAEASRVVNVRTELPARVERFVGRHEVVTDLVGRRRGLAAIVGMAGAGKTQLALHVADELVASGAVDRTLFVDLRGFDADRPPADPWTVLEALLHATGSERGRLPAEGAARRRLLADRLAATRTLLVLDDAAGPDQVAAIVPDAPSTPVLATSRVDLGPVAGDATVALGVFTPAEAIDVLGLRDGVGTGTDDDVGTDDAGSTGSTGSTGTDDDVGDASELVDLVGRLPLAVGLLASRLATRAGWTVADHVRSMRAKLAQLQVDEAVRAAIDLSYQALGDEARRMLRLLATQPCGPLDLPAAAALTGRSTEEAGVALDELRAANVVAVDGHGRIDLHALVRARAASRALDDDAPSERDEAVGRLEEYMVGRVWAAVRALHGDRVAEQRHPVALAALVGWHDPTPDEASAWLDAELENLIRLAETRPDRRRRTTAVELSEALARHLEGRGLTLESTMLHELALSTARELGDERGERLATLHLGQILVRVGDVERATALLARAHASGETAGEASVVMRAANTLAILDARAGRFAESLEKFESSLAAARDLGAEESVAVALDNVAVVHRRLGDLERAADLHRRAHEHAVAHGVPQTAANALMNLSDVLIALGDPAAALDAATRARDACRRDGLAPTEAYATTNIGLALVELGQIDAAIAHHDEALAAARRVANRSLEVGVLNNLGDALVAAGRRDEATERFVAAERLAIELDDVFELERARNGLGG